MSSIVKNFVRRALCGMHPVCGLFVAGLRIRFVKRRAGTGESYTQAVPFVDNDAGPSDVPRKQRWFIGNE